MNPSVYIETTIIGHLTSRLPRDPDVALQMLSTRKWWGESRRHFHAVTSLAVVDEISEGGPVAAAERLEAIRDLPLIPTPPESAALAALLLSRHALPAQARVDALHVAIAATNDVRYLLTWNCRHIANATLREKITATCRELG